MTTLTHPRDEAFLDDRLLRLQDVASYLNVSRSFAYFLVESGQLPSVRLGKAVRVQPGDLIAFVEQNKQPGPSSFTYTRCKDS